MTHGRTMQRRLFLQAGAGLAAATALSGCQELLPTPEPPPKLYRLTPKSTFGDDLTPVSWQLVVDAPYAEAAIKTQRIALMYSPIQLDYYAGANWIDRAPDMIQGLIVESFENSNMISSVGRQSAGLRSNFVLLPEVREFQAEYFETSLPVAHVRINVKLIKMPDRTIVDNASFEASTQAISDSMDAIIKAFDDALGKVLRNLVRWTLTVGDVYV
ncbi:MAG: membrane integrity-associated transporter subunit PqiC [Rhodospirillales bacterium]|nr:membrane integrity-associated transporter subunit PqiC [Rhodospirillales bacterium]